MMQKIFTITDRTCVYVYCPAGVVTGGVELLHQLVDVINRNNGKAYIVYYGKNNHEIPNEYKKYKIYLSNSIEDNSNNIVVVPEVNIQTVFCINCAQILLWWLSVDNFFSSQKLYLSMIDIFLFYGKIDGSLLLAKIKSFLRTILKPKTKSDFRYYSLRSLRFKSNIVCNAYQSEYAKSFLKKQKFRNLYPLKDYINSDYQFDPSLLFQKEDIILYNPMKGFNFTKKLMAAAPDLNWLALQGMTRDKVRDTMKRSKLYIDFGNHPGKDRFPREAAMSGCCIITGKRGSAKFWEDVSIDEFKYKFDQTAGTVSQVVSAIRHILNNYMDCINDFSEYRDRISKERLEFEHQAIDLLVLADF